MPNIKAPGLEIVRDSLTQISAEMQPSVASSMWSPLANHLTDVFFQYPSNEWMEITGLINHLVAASGDGKNELMRLIESLCPKFRLHDEEEMEKLVEWSKQVKTKGANKEKPVRPDVAFWMPPSDVTNAAFLQNAVACELLGRHSQYFKVPEVEMLNKLCGGHANVSKLIRNIFDVARDGALRATADGVIGNPTMRVNMTALSTPEAARAFYKKDLRIGTFGRVMFSYKPRRARKGKIPRQGKYEQAFIDRMDRYVVRLEACKGRFVVSGLNKLADRLAEEFTDIADLYDDETVYENMKRTIIMAWKVGCILWILNNQRWTRAIGDFVEWLAYHDLWSKQQVFGDMLRKSEEEATVTTTKTGPKNMLDSLSDTFSEADLELLRLSDGKSKEGTRAQLKAWKHRGFIDYSAETGLYTKTQAYLNR